MYLVNSRGLSSHVDHLNHLEHVWVVIDIIVSDCLLDHLLKEFCTMDNFTVDNKILCRKNVGFGSFESISKRFPITTLR